MDDALPLLIVIVIACAVVYGLVTVASVPVTNSLAQIETAKATQAQAAANLEAARQDGATQRAQVFGLTLAGIIAMAKTPDVLVPLLLGVPLWVLAYMAWRSQQARG